MTISCNWVKLLAVFFSIRFKLTPRPRNLETDCFFVYFFFFSGWSSRTRPQGFHSFIFSLAKMLCRLRSSITFGSKKRFWGEKKTKKTKQTKTQTSASIKVRVLRPNPAAAAATRILQCAVRARNTAFHFCSTQSFPDACVAERWIKAALASRRHWFPTSHLGRARGVMDG